MFNGITIRENLLKTDKDFRSSFEKKERLIIAVFYFAVIAALIMLGILFFTI